MTSLLFGILVLVIVAAVPAAADVLVYVWRDKNETINMTDDAKRIPLAYKPNVRVLDVDGLANYPLLTIDNYEAKTETADERDTRTFE